MICFSFQRDNFKIITIFLCPLDEMMIGVFLNMVGIYLYLMLIRHMSLFKTESEAKLIYNAIVLNL